MGSPERPVTDSSNVIFPRRKQGQHKKHGRKEGVVVTMEILETVFHLPLHKACKDLVSCVCIVRRAFVQFSSIISRPLALTRVLVGWCELPVLHLQWLAF